MQFKFVYVGRLDTEKGLEDIVFAFEKLLSHGSNVRLDLFGQEGNCSQLVRTLQHTFPDAVCYHGRQDKSIIAEYRTSCHYVLMPSYFLETFGLACLDAYSYAKPVIWYKKWWLQELIIDDYAISSRQYWQTNIDSLYKKITQLLQNFDTNIYSKDCQICGEIYETYSKTKWKENVENICSSLGFPRSRQKPPSLLLVSDYLYRFWWIEAFLYDSKEQLRNMGYRVDLFGSSIASSLLRKVWLLSSILNIGSAVTLFYKLLSTAYALVWLHSIQRYLWWFPLWILSFFSVKKVFMLHDLWLLHPYPSLVTDEQQLQFSWTFHNYLLAGRDLWKTSFLNKLAMTAKFMSSSVIRSIFQNSIDVYLVPSSFLIPHLSRWLGNKKSYRIDLLSHFVSQ